MKKLTKELLTGVVALGMLAPVATSALNPVNITVNARRRTRRHYHRPRRHARRRVRRVRRRSHRSYRVTGYARWFSRNAKRLNRRYHSSRSYMNGINDGLNGGTYDGGALLNMDSAHHSKYYKGWVIGNAISRAQNFVHDGYVYSSPRNYNNAIRLYRQGERYGDNTGAEYLQYENGSWSKLGSTDTSDIGNNSNVLATLYGNYRL